MADSKYEVDDEGNLVEVDRPVDNAAPGDAAADSAPEQTVTEEQRRLFLGALLASDVIGVLVLAGAAVLLPESRAILAILAIAYLIASIPIFIWMSRSTRRKVEESQRRYSVS